MNVETLADNTLWDDDGACRRCIDCRGYSHHWMEGFDEDEDGELIDPDAPRWQCKHCGFSMPYEDEGPEDQYQAMLAHLREVAAGLRPEVRALVTGNLATPEQAAAAVPGVTPIVVLAGALGLARRAGLVLPQRDVGDTSVYLTPKGRAIASLVGEQTT